MHSILELRHLKTLHALREAGNLLRAAVLRGFAAVAASTAGADGWSPITRLSGHILKTGHFLQPATMAIGQTVMGNPADGLRVAEYGRDAHPEVVCFA